MELKKLISVQQFFTCYKTQAPVLMQLHELDLIEIIDINEILYISKSQVKEVAKIIRLDFDLDIHAEGIAVPYILLRKKNVEKEVIMHENRNNFYKN